MNNDNMIQIDWDQSVFLINVLSSVIQQKRILDELKHVSVIPSDLRYDIPFSRSLSMHHEGSFGWKINMKKRLINTFNPLCNILC